MTTSMTNQRNHAHRHHHLFRKDLQMLDVELWRADVAERHERLRALRGADRAGQAQARSLRQRVGRSIIRLGRLVGGDAMTAPAWQG